jgi:preprotein translocase subunit SecG
MIRTILTILQVLSAFVIGASGTVFGARGATTGLSRMTAVFAAIFMINSLALTYLFQRDARAAPTSLLDKVPAAASTPAPAATPAPAVPAPLDANAVPPAPAAATEQKPEQPRN